VVIPRVLAQGREGREGRGPAGEGRLRA
jgi:hypothetical protein